MTDTAVMATTFLFQDSEHDVGDAECGACWFGRNEPCPEEDGGRIHTSFGDENYDGDYWLYERCDVEALAEATPVP